MNHDSRNKTRLSLIERVRDANDVESWKAFDAIYRPLLRKYAAARGVRGDMIDEIAQIGMMRIHAKLATFVYDPLQGGFRAYLKTMVRNLVLNHFRQEKTTAANAAALEAMVDHDDTPDEAFDKAWREEHIRASLELLRPTVSPDHFAVFHKRMIEGCTVEALAAEFGMTANNVYKITLRLTRGLRMTLIEMLGADAESLLPDD